MASMPLIRPTTSRIGSRSGSEPTLRVTHYGGAVLFAHRNQQSSIYANSNSSGAVVERIAYTAYGQSTFMNAAGTVQSTSTNSIRYSYTGREWDAALQLHHFRARWMGPVTDGFWGRDPIGYERSLRILYEFLSGMLLSIVNSTIYLKRTSRLLGRITRVRQFGI